MLACAALVNRPGGRAGLADAMLNHSYRINDQRQPLDSENPAALLLHSRLPTSFQWGTDRLSVTGVT